MLVLGIDLGTSSIKASVVDTQTQKCIASVQYPENESAIISLHEGWAEQSPLMWWEHVQQAILKMNSLKLYSPEDISAIGIAYQMHGLVIVDKELNPLRNAIIWCDSRAIDIGNNAFDTIGKEKCLNHLLNSPGNFTASKLFWVKQNEPNIYDKIFKVMLPGDFISMKMTGSITTSISALSEGIFWDFSKDELSEDVFNYFNFSKELIPSVQNVFSEHGFLHASVASKLSLKSGIPITYKAGDQPNNALSLHVFEPGEVAATAGTSGVIYSVSDNLVFDHKSRVNTFAHVNYTPEKKRLGVLLCINGAGSMNSRMKQEFASQLSYNETNNEAKQARVGSEGLMVLPFCNGAERMLENKTVGAHFVNLDYNKHKLSHIFRSVQEGVAFAFRYGLDIMRENGIHPKVIRAGKANMFLSDVFTEAFVNSINVPLELYENDGSVGAAMGAAIGKKIFTSEKEAFLYHKPIKTIEPHLHAEYAEIYEKWIILLAHNIYFVN